jgi:hypothetical protein
LAKQYERYEAHAIALTMVAERIWWRAPASKALAAFDDPEDRATNGWAAGAEIALGGLAKSLFISNLM